ncbi:hypothetical protein PP914_gp061 [Arthrobacter phage Qui]|uniref:Uncharacterized protein n=1 Tax=Arthrobacter phage Qui TaxID=2603260 RepID=A0A5B8WGX7_9CAUD|nr:hypothetical protein PP914_gp061 [Arthrobacter phage Qui]QED11551.1 hypothetical protein SEA_QUI_61 [Arthrobacter phage Qui]
MRGANTASYFFRRNHIAYNENPMKGSTMTEIDLNDPYTVAESMNETVSEWVEDIKNRNFRLSNEKTEMLIMFLDIYVDVNKALVSDMRRKDKMLNELLKGITRQE